MKINYTILSNSNPYRLSNQVKDFMEKGWDIHGNMVVTNTLWSTTFYQAMVWNYKPVTIREKKPEPVKSRSKN